MKKSTVLVVDDQLFFRQLISTFLERHDYNILLAKNGTEAWEILVKNYKKIMAITLDCIMPEMNGIELLKKIKNSHILCDIPIIMITSQQNSKDIEQGLAAGANYYLDKSFKENIVNAILTSAINDYKKLVNIKNDIDIYKKATNAIITCNYRFRHPSELKNFIPLLSSACPEPHNAAFGLSELMLNSIEHGNLGLSYNEKTVLLESGEWADELNKRLEKTENTKKYAEVFMKKDENQINFVIKDSGNGFEWEKYLELDTARAFDSHGRGIAFAKQRSFNDLKYMGNGNEVHCTINLPDKSQQDVFKEENDQRI